MNQAEIKRRQVEEIANILTLITIFVLGNRMEMGGITYMTAAVSVCLLMGMIVSGNLADTLGRLLRSRRNKGQYKNILMMRKSALLLSLGLGLAGTLILILAAGGIEKKIIQIPNSTFILMALAPVVFLRTISSVLQGFFQGEASEMPRAVSGILRLIFTFGFGLLFGHILGDYGGKVSALLKEENYTPMYSCLGIALAVCLAELFVILFLSILFKVSRRNERKKDFAQRKQEGMYTGDSMGDCIMSISAGRWPYFVTELLVFLPFALGLAVFARRTAEETDAVFQYDVYMGRYLVICGILFSLISILVLPVMGKVFLYFRKEEGRFARTAFQSGVHFCLIHGIFLSLYVAVMAAQIAGLLGGENAEIVKQMLQGGSSLFAFGALAVYFARFLQATGRKYFLLGAAGIAEVIFAVMVLVLSKQGILALVYGGVLGTFVLCLLLGFLSYRQLRIRMDWIGTLVLPLGVGGIIGLLCMLLGKLLTESLGNGFTLLISFLLCGGVYWIALLVLRNLKETELELLPGGRLLGMIGQKMHLY